MVSEKDYEITDEKMRNAFELLQPTLRKIWSFPLRISSEDVTKSTVSCSIGHVYLRNP